MTSIGVGYQRPDAAAKARGETIYCVDYAEPGMLHGVLLRSPVAAGRILRLDFSKARTMPGVRAVICQADVPQILGGWILCDMPMFALDVVRYIGEPVAAVAADTLDQARRARDAIILEIEETPAVATMEAAIAPDAPLIHPNLASYRLAEENLPPFPRYRNIAAETASLADPRAVDAAFARAAHIVEDEFRSQRQYQAALETKNAVGAIRDGRFIVHSGTQWPFNVRARICQYFGVPTSKVRVIGHPFGGGFRRKAGRERRTPRACVVEGRGGTCGQTRQYPVGRHHNQQLSRRHDHPLSFSHRRRWKHYRARRRVLHG